MSYCIRCGNSNPPGAFYCYACSQPLTPDNQPYGEQHGDVPPPTAPYDLYHQDLYPPAPGNPHRNGIAMAALVLGICSIPFCVLSYFSMPVALLAIIFGIIGVKSQKKMHATAGLVCGIVGLILMIFFAIMISS